MQIVAADAIGAISPQASEMAFLIGGIVVALLAVVFLDWALIGISSILGAVMISQWVVHGALLRSLAFAVLFLGGSLVQARMMQTARPRTTEAS
jgi:hypothetical protein